MFWYSLGSLRSVRLAVMALVFFRWGPLESSGLGGRSIRHLCVGARPHSKHVRERHVVAVFVVHMYVHMYLAFLYHGMGTEKDPPGRDPIQEQETGTGIAGAIQLHSTFPCPELQMSLHFCSECSRVDSFIILSLTNPSC